ncbi:MAG TPA: Gfo/Idh/MocA family oxidoreductase [Chloroflexi bacterium]|nr:Gfo/Idh/MocA family oxidoreductase [Chloroflexota bacterium]
MEPVRWGVMGCARIAVNQVIPAMLQAEGAAVQAIASRTLAKAQDTAKEFGIARAYGSYEELLADPELEAIYIPLLNHLHKPWSIAAVRAGKHVLCEKPIALSGQEAREMQAAREETGCYLLEAFAPRFGPVIQTAIDIISSGRLGELRTIHTTLSFVITPDPSNVRLQADIGGGALYDVGCYALNHQLMLAGRHPRSAWAKLEWSPRFHVDMSGAGVLDYGDGLFGTFDMGFTAQGSSYFRVVGTRGKLEAVIGTGSAQRSDTMLLTVGGSTEEIVLPPSNNYVLEVQDLSEAIRGLHPPKFGDEPLDATMRLLDACYASDKSGRAENV